MAPPASTARSRRCAWLRCARSLSMSLLTLPNEALSDIICRLSRADRRSLRLVHPVLARFLSASNAALWRHVYVERFATRASKPPLSGGDASLLCELHDIADDYLIHRTLPTVTLRGAREGWRSSPFVAHVGTLRRLFVADGNRLAAVSTRTWRELSGCDLPARASCLHADDDAVAVGMHDGVVHVSTKRSVRCVKAHKRAVSCVLLHPQLLISASEDTTIRLRDRHSRRSVGVLRGHGTRIRCMHLMSDTRLATSGHSDQRIKLWDLQQLSCVSTARLGEAVTHCVHYNGLLYAMAAHTLHVLDPRQGFSCTAAFLTLPRGSAWRSPIGALTVASDGSLAAAVGSGGVAVWDARGTWEATAYGWPNRWDGRPSRLLRALYLGQSVIVAGGGAKELLTFSRSGSYEGIIAEQRVRKAPISYINQIDSRLVVADEDGSVDYANVDSAVVDWDTVHRVFEEEHSPKTSLWHTSLAHAPYPPFRAEEAS